MNIRISEIFRLSLPAILLVSFIYLASFYSNIEFIVRFLPSFEVAGIFYFAIYREEVIPKWFLMFIGLLKDSLTGVPFGTYPAIYMAVFLMIASNRRMFIREPFISVWISFAIYYAIFLALKCCLYSIYYKTLWFNQDVFVEWSLSTAIFVSLYLLFNRIYMILPMRGI